MRPAFVLGALPLVLALLTFGVRMRAIVLTASVSLSLSKAPVTG